MAFPSPPVAGQQYGTLPAYGSAPGYGYGPAPAMQAPMARPPPLSFRQLEEFGNVPYVTTRDRYAMSRNKPRVVTPPGVDAVDFAKDLKEYKNDTRDSLRMRKALAKRGTGMASFQQGAPVSPSVHTEPGYNQQQQSQAQYGGKELYSPTVEQETEEERRTRREKEGKCVIS